MHYMGAVRVHVHVHTCPCIMYHATNNLQLAMHKMQESFSKNISLP